ncbi:MAG: NAD(P)H-hydrate dehydratase [Actinomycetota bacterium]|nr:NAD(P)H-hydrate dehydratase [Actinomycetota bacterium]
MREWLAPLPDAGGMRAMDAWAIDEQGVPSLQLMEAAGAALAEAVAALAPSGPIRVVCGKGNNGGDGLVCARLLRERGFAVEALLCWPQAELSRDAAANLERFDGAVMRVEGDGATAAIAGSGTVVDAIFGTGFAGAPRSPAAEAIAGINASGAPVVAADIASGVDASTGETAGLAVNADVTVAFHAAKPGHLISPGKRRTGELTVAPIGIPGGAPVAAAAASIGSGVLALPPRRDAGSSKFSSGHVLLIGGSTGLTGAVALAASAAIRAGAGYATAAVPDDLEPILEVKLTEVMTAGIASGNGSFAVGSHSAALAVAERAAAIVLGPGLGRSDGARAMAAGVVAEASAPLVIDADALNALDGRLDEVGARAKATVLTPHSGELGRLLGRPREDVEARRLASARDAAGAARCVVVLKGDDTLVVDGRSADMPVAVNALASPALATAGTGDVLAGTIGALIARGLDEFDAACAGVYAHARAGRIAAERVGTAESVIAGDVVDALAAGLRP